MMDRRKAHIGPARYFLCIFNHRNKRHLDRAERSINRELDLTSFIKLQTKVRAMLKTVFTKTELAVLAHNRRFSLKENDAEPTSDSDNFSMLPKLRDVGSHMKERNPYIAKLLEDTEAHYDPDAPFGSA
jgi:hypothetical protein